jgi:hypothetical protein
LNGEKTEGEIKEGKTLGLNCTLDGGLKAKGARERRVRWGNGRRRRCCAEQGREPGEADDADRWAWSVSG